MQQVGNNTDNIYVLLLIGMAGMFLLASAVVLFYIRNQQRMRRQKEAELQHQKDLTYAVIQSQEAERKRIGRDLHDDVGSSLSHLKLYADGHPALMSQVDAILGKVRDISHMLSPAELELFGLEDALEELCRVVHQSGAVTVVFDNAVQEPLGQLAYEQALSMYRVLQELFANTVRHAGASQVTLSVRQETGALVFSYEDNGKGLGSSTPGMGLRNIESRLAMIGATYRLSAQEGRGFGITIYLT